MKQKKMSKKMIKAIQQSIKIVKASRVSDKVKNKYIKKARKSIFFHRAVLAFLNAEG